MNGMTTTHWENIPHAPPMSAGRLPTLNLSYAFIGLISSKNTHIPQLPQVA